MAKIKDTNAEMLNRMKKNAGMKKGSNKTNENENIDNSIEVENKNLNRSKDKENNKNYENEIKIKVEEKENKIKKKALDKFEKITLDNMNYNISKMNTKKMKKNYYIPTGVIEEAKRSVEELGLKSENEFITQAVMMLVKKLGI